MNKKIFKTCIIFLLILTLLIALTGCQKNNETDNQNYIQEDSKEVASSFSELIEKLVEDEKILNGEVAKSYYSPKENKLLKDDCEGILSITFADFNNDNEEECIISRLTSNDNITLTMYKSENNTAKEISSLNLFENVLNFGDRIYLDIFAKKINNETKIFLDAYHTSSLLADGTNWTFASYKIIDNKFKEDSKDSTAGSAFMPDELEEYKEKIKKTGLNVNDFSISLNSKKLIEQNTDIIKLCNISRKHLSNFNSSKYINSNETKVNYGETIFTDYSKTTDNENTNANEENTNNIVNSNKNNTNVIENSTGKGAQVQTINTINISDYLGNWICEFENDTIQFSLVKQDNKITYYFLYYPNGSSHASEELWGNWDYNNKNMLSINNENSHSIATYDFTNIEYNKNSIEITTKSKKILLPEFEKSKIPDGKYVFKKSN